MSVGIKFIENKIAISSQSGRTFAEFFAGIGLVRMGLEAQGWSIAFANDIDEKKLEMYKGQFQDVDEHFVLGDIHKLPASDVPDIALATASFPCTDLSLAGMRNGLKGEHSSAFWGFVNILENMRTRRPPIIMLENVVGFLTSHKGQDFREALLALNSIGYSVDAFILDAAWFVPQSRQRLFVIGVQDGFIGSSQVSQSEIRPKALVEFMNDNSDIVWSIRELPVIQKTASKLADVLDDLSEDSDEWWSKERAEYLLNQMSDRHREIAESMINGEEFSYGTVFRRVRNSVSMAELRTDGIAGCLRTPRGGSGRQILFKAGKGRYFVRLLTPRECARLMGVDDFNITVSANQALFGFGDAVCVPCISWIAEHYLNPLYDEIPKINKLRAI